MARYSKQIHKVQAEGAPLMFVVSLLLFMGCMAEAGTGASLMAAAKAAGPRCDACPVNSGSVCAEMPTVPGVTQTVMSKCLAECQGFTRIQQGACKPYNNNGVPSTASSEYIPIIRDFETTVGR